MKILVTGGSGFIGSNYIDYLEKYGKAEFINIDIKKPLKKEHSKYFIKCDIMDYEKLEKIIKDFKPSHVVHLAAKTGASTIRDIDEFAPNIKGVENLINSLLKINTVEHVIFTSTLLVCKMGYVPKNDVDYNPTTAYGRSKVEGEKIIRNWENLPFIWTIVRPISVWGPYMMEPYYNFFRAIKKGWYVHIGNGHYKRSMGYVGNIVYEIHSILRSASSEVNWKTFYLGDPEPTDLYYFAERVRELLGAPKIKKMPLSIMKIVAGFGDVLKFLGWKNVPISSFRLKNILTEYVYDLSPIIRICGNLPFDLDTAIKNTVKWFVSNS